MDDPIKKLVNDLTRLSFLAAPGMKPAHEVAEREQVQERIEKTLRELLKPEQKS